MNDSGSASEHEEDNQAAKNKQRNDARMLAMAVIGVTNCRYGTHVPCVPRLENADVWINRKGFYSQNVLAACSFDMKFTYMLAGYKGSCHDARILEEVIAFHGFPIPPPGINSYPMEKQVMIPVACAVVHNFIRMVQVGNPFLEEYAADCVPVRGIVDVNADDVFDDGIDGTGPSTGTQRHDSRRGAMNQLRDMMADDMWDRYQSYPWYKAT
ncbi:hypothetical protein TIFTF001_015247 [Ficus carica]|uniref:DDE Tnp4 domain-containing protein n=1 Tax=Ficus carica TaxID=3494 RepID=A0AA88D4Y4_FICCA|nr:hypothetical protein TIFTF001_015247 [Ficus carica]